jgi:hypothetical protein
MSMKKAPSKVRYEGEVLETPAIYPRSTPVAVSVYALAPDLVYEHASSIFKIETNANEDFSLALQLMVLNPDGTETPIDLGTSPVLEFYIRPRFDHLSLIKKLTVGSGIVLDDAATGKITLYLPQATVATDLLVPKYPAQQWDYFFNLLGSGTVTELFRGPFVVHAGRYP